MRMMSSAFSKIWVTCAFTVLISCFCLYAPLVSAAERPIFSLSTDTLASESGEDSSAPFVHIPLHLSSSPSLEIPNPRPLSRIETAYTERLTQPTPHEAHSTKADTSDPAELHASKLALPRLQQFGYDLFIPIAPVADVQKNSLSLSEDPTSHPLFLPARLPSGTLKDSYLLGQGDVIHVTLTGAITSRETSTINGKGLLHITHLPPIETSGLSLGGLRERIQQLASDTLSAQAHVTLNHARHIEVLIGGHVKTPGRYHATAFHSILDALSLAGGPTHTGSLRAITLIRDGNRSSIDLYPLLLDDRSFDHSTAQHAPLHALTLRDGDQLIVPTLGRTVGLAGDLKRPGIYELPPAGHMPLSLSEALRYAGGPLNAGTARFIKFSNTERDHEMTTALSLEDSDAALHDGALLLVEQGSFKRFGQITLIGHTHKPGIHALNTAPSVHALLSKPGLIQAETYPLLGLIARWNPVTLAPVYIDFPLRAVLDRRYDLTLQDDDRIYLFSYKDMRMLRNAHPPQPIDIVGSPPSSAAVQDSLLPHDIQDYLMERSLFVRGAVRYPGRYPVSTRTSLDMAIAVAGGATREASTEAIELTSALNGYGLQADGGSGTHRIYVNLHDSKGEHIALQAGDRVRVNQRFHKIQDHSILLLGEVQRPGRYDLMEGDMLSTLLSRAGGLTTVAYPKGAIFSRASERKAEEHRYQAQATLIRQAMASALSPSAGPGKNRTTHTPTAAQLSEAQTLADTLDNARGIGRITVEADPAILRTQPALDTLLHSGDRIFIPKRTSTVRVSGEVLSPAALQFQTGKSVRDYIREAGGFSYHADKDRVFVVYPDGSAQPMHVSAWNHSPIFIPAGSTVIVPRDPKPFNFIAGFKDITQILSNIAVTSLFVSDLDDG